MIDHYKVLGVSRIASRDEVHKAFLRTSSRYNSDRNKEPASEAHLLAIIQAHDILYDPARRSAYDFQVWKSPGQSSVR